ncbi:MAG: hypothetical protein RIF36_06610 [Imperialibacter sp.]|uniref:hypothetical protein n=1 Tax=Imperialibacter sp. TaxID=2038411 RepID=UPI0032EC4828
MMKEKGFGPPVYASLVLAFASFGDAYLYAFLPVNATGIGLSLASVGLLLSINRFIRLFANQWLLVILAKYGFRLITIVAAGLAALSTLGYGAGLGLVGWLLMRVIWGVAFSAMRISSLTYALGHHSQGLSLGISRSVYELGPMAALLLGPLLIAWLGHSWAFICLGLASLPAVYFAFRLPDLTPEIPATGRAIAIPTPFNMLTFFITFAVEGVMVVVLGAALIKSDFQLTPASAAATAAAYLAYRRFCLIFLSPLGGWLADRLGLARVLIAATLFICVGLVMVTIGWPMAGFAVAFLFGSIQAALGPGVVAAGRVSAVSANATWRDAGAAFGTLTGGLLLTSGHLSLSFIVLAIGIAIALLAYLRSLHYTFKTLIAWK